MKKQILISGTVAILAAVGITAATSSATIDLPYVNKRIDNLEARVTNNEADIKQLQTTTQTSAAPHVDVPEAPAAQPVSETAVVGVQPAPPPTVVVLPPTPAPGPWSVYGPPSNRAVIAQMLSDTGAPGENRDLKISNCYAWFAAYKFDHGTTEGTCGALAEYVAY